MLIQTVRVCVELVTVKHHGEHDKGRSSIVISNSPEEAENAFPDYVMEPKAPEEANPVVDDVLRRLTAGEDAKRELVILKPTLAYALSKLDKKQLRVRAADMETLSAMYTMQAKSDGNGGIILRSVKTREVNGL